MILTKPQQLIIVVALDVLYNDTIGNKEELKESPDYVMFYEERIKLIKETRKLINELEFKDGQNSKP